MSTAGKAMADGLARDRILNELDVTMLVEAAAGTGKTTSLVGRMLNLVRTGRARASTIAAITFTVKAAAHLRERFQEALEGALKAGGDLREQERFRTALDEIDRGFIGTTHAFCARLLRERPVEAGLDPEFEELDAAASSHAASDFWNRWSEAQALTGNPLLEEARQIDVDRPILRGAFLRLVEHPDARFVSQRQARPDLRPLCERLSQLLDECAPHLPSAFDRDVPDAFEALIVGLLRVRVTSDLRSDLRRQLAFLEDADHATARPVQRRWPDRAVAKRLGEDYRDFVINTLRPGLQRWREYAHGVVIELLRPALQEFTSLRRERGTLTFQDLLLFSRDLLRDHPPVRRYFQRRFTHLLVDEFQDTDPLQAEVLLFLTSDHFEERIWRKLTPRPGSLFIVGDPKQSIYRFRRADITTYLEVKSRIEASGGKVVALSTNFRSGPAICDFVNTTFDELFLSTEVEAGRQAPNVRLAAHHDPAAPVGVYHLESQDGRNEVMAEAEAECIAQWIRRAVDNQLLIDDQGDSRPLRYEDVLLVSWQRPRLVHYGQALERHGIPYAITGSKAFSRADALRQAMPLLRAVAEPEDAVSVAAFLRGPLWGIDDDTLYRFARSGGRFSPFAEVPAGSDLRIATGLATIRDAIVEAKTHPPAATISRLFDRVGLIAASATGPQPGTSSGNLLLALSIAREESRRGESLASIVASLEQMLESNPDIEELDVDPARPDAVRLMNLHQVKGLEAPVVFLIDPAGEFEFPIDLIIDRSGEESLAHIVVTKKWGRKDKEIAIPANWDRHLQTEAAFRSAERKRLLYVAATRARNILVVGFRRTSKGIEGAWRELAARVRVPLFPAGDHQAVATARNAIDVQFADATNRIDAQFQASKQTSYSVMPITKIAHPDHATLVRAEEGLGKGTSWGRVLHRLFEAVLRDAAPDLALYAENLLKDEERDPMELDEVLAVLVAVKGSPLWQRVLASPERYVEVPFALMVSRREAGLDEDGETLLHGTIDLVFREGGRWFVVDYKSDSTKGRLEELVAYYRTQIDYYARFWSRLTSAPVSAGLFFVDGCIERWVS